MAQLRLLGLLLGAAACGGRAGSQGDLGSSPEAAVGGFLAAAADSNVGKMASLWGTSKGSAAATGQPSDFERRIIVMQVYLRNSGHKVISNSALEGRDDRRMLQVQLDKSDCVKVVPMTVVRTESGGWLVSDVGLEAAGNPGNPCATKPPAE